MYFDRLEKFVENKSSSISNYDLLVLENEYYKQYAEVGESIHLMDSCLYEIDLLSYTNKDHFGSFEDLAIPNSTALATTDQKGKLSQIWTKIIEFLKKLWDQLSDLFKKAKEFLFAKSKLLIGKIDKIARQIRIAHMNFVVEIPTIPMVVYKEHPAFDLVLKLGSVITENMTLEQIKSVNSKIQHIDNELVNVEQSFNKDMEDRTLIKISGSSLDFIEKAKTVIKSNVQYIDGYNKNIESAKMIMKKMHPDRFVGQDQSLPTAITQTASSASTTYKTAIKCIKNIIDALEDMINNVEKQINKQVEVSQE